MEKWIELTVGALFAFFVGMFIASLTCLRDK
jgi:hypothetical protein